jgi:hypothetical protein
MLKRIDEESTFALTFAYVDTISENEGIDNGPWNK